MKILIVENGFNDLKESRMPLGYYFQTLGNEVIYACPNPIESEIHNISMSRNSIIPHQLFQGYLRLSSLEFQHSVDVVLTFRLIPNFLSYLASFRNKKTKRVAVISGLGYAFVSNRNSISVMIQRTLIKLFYRSASKRIQIITQNQDDIADLGITNGKVVLGSGVKGVDFSRENKLDTSSIKLLYVGRLLKSKGIYTAIMIFEKLQSRANSVSFTIAGTIDEDNPDSITEIELGNIKNKKGVNYLGFVNNMGPIYKECNVLLFPSVYREGVPRVIIESLNYGLTVVTKDMPGCKETIKENGFLITENYGVEQAVEYLSSLDSKKLLENSKKSKELFESTFSSEVIYPQYLSYLT